MLVPPEGWFFNLFCFEIILLVNLDHNIAIVGLDD